MELDNELAARSARSAGRERLADAIERAQIIVMAQADVDRVSHEKYQEQGQAEIPRSDLEDLLCKTPFPITYFEPMGAPYKIDGEKMRYAILAEEISTSPLSFQIHGFMFTDHGTKIIGCQFELADDGVHAVPLDRFGNLHMGKLHDKGEWAGIMGSLVSNFCQFMATYLHRETRTGTASERVKDRHGRAQPREIIYIRRVNQELSANPKLTSKPIEWSHSWRVSGTWVRVKGVGKDRTGKYCVKGMTWRVPHVKGKGKLVEKIRVRTKLPGEANDGLEEREVDASAQTT